MKVRSTILGLFVAGFVMTLLAPLLGLISICISSPTGSRPGLLLVQDGQDTENDGNALWSFFGRKGRCLLLQLDLHETATDGLGNVFEMHRLTLDQDTDRDDGVDGAGEHQADATRLDLICFFSDRSVSQQGADDVMLFDDETISQKTQEPNDNECRKDNLVSYRSECRYVSSSVQNEIDAIQIAESDKGFAPAK